MSVRNDPARLRLPEDPCQADDRKSLRVDQIPKNIAGTDARKLINIADQDQSHGIGHRFQEVIHQHNIDHGTLVHDQHIALKGIFFISLIAFRHFHFQKTVNGLCLPAGGDCTSFGPC